MAHASGLAPIVKWVGGKRQLLKEIIPRVPSSFSTYVEPFVGGGAVLFDLAPSRAIINDSNEELINVYRAIRDNPKDLVSKLHRHDSLNSSDYFYEVRAWDRQPTYKNLSSTTRAARIIYLNKTCYNGLFRVNQSGFFNTPYGRYKRPRIVNEPLIMALSAYFTNNDITILNGDYTDALRNLPHDSFVYFDPPYMPISSSASFTGYTEQGFGFRHQQELKAECDKLTDQGIPWLLSNSKHPDIIDLYSSYSIDIVTANRSVNSKASKRGAVEEILVNNYDHCKQ